MTQQVAHKARGRDAVLELRTQLEARTDEFSAALPTHMEVERFRRVLMTAVASNPDLLAADRQSLIEAAMRAAQDGLLPDGRDGALVIYSTKAKRGGRDEWIKKVQWMPMIGGVLKLVRNSGELANITAQVVYGGDTFRTWIDDQGEHVEYEAGEEQDHSLVRRVFAAAWMKDGTLHVETMSVADVEKVRSVSRSKDRGPWVDWWDQMARKTVLRRLAKRLPLSTDLMDVMHRDDGFYDLSRSPEQPRRVSVRERLRAARERDHEAPRALPSSEGFSADFVEGEIGGGSAEQAEPQTIEAEPVSEAVPAGDAAPSPDALIAEYRDELAACETEAEVRGLDAGWADKLKDAGLAADGRRAKALRIKALAEAA